jgi:hypothetical protein
MNEEKGVDSSELCYIFWLPLHWSTYVIHAATCLNHGRRATGLEIIWRGSSSPGFCENKLYVYRNSETVCLWQFYVFHHIHTRWVKARSWPYTPWVKLPGSEAVIFLFLDFNAVKIYFTYSFIGVKIFCWLWNIKFLWFFKKWIQFVFILFTNINEERIDF